MTNLPQPYIDYEPVRRRRKQELEPGMLVRPRASKKGARLDPMRWVVETVSGAFTRASCGRGSRYRTQYWATDSLFPVKLKKRARAVTAPASPKPAKAPGAPKKVTTPRPAKAEGPDPVALALKNLHGLDALLDYAAGRGYPECDTLRAKVSHLNPGLQRMNVGNRLRRWLAENAGA